MLIFLTICSDVRNWQLTWVAAGRIASLQVSMNGLGKGMNIAKKQ
jgi:hypothetical protein